LGFFAINILLVIDSPGVQSPWIFAAFIQSFYYEVMKIKKTEKWPLHRGGPLIFCRQAGRPGETGIGKGTTP
jgi:hypothetical protein